MKEIEDEEGNEGTVDDANLLAQKPKAELEESTRREVHVLKEGIICRTDHRARQRTPLEIVLDATDGFIPLWEKNRILRWRFNPASIAVFQKPLTVKRRIRALLGKAVAAWGDSAPIRFRESSDNPDFEIVVEQHADCTPQGCVLASAFFPDSGRHQLYIYPTMFEQTEKEQVDTMAHEIGHVFGLRHFFAPEHETPWPSVVFGEHEPFSIMNYGDLSGLTDADRRDLKALYEAAWCGQLTQINGTPIRLVRPFHYRD